MRVRCISKGRYKGFLTDGKIYDVISERDGCYKLLDNDRRIGHFYKEYFKVINTEQIKIKQWSDLEGLESKDKWGNKTIVAWVNSDEINIKTSGIGGAAFGRLFYLDNRFKGGRERVLEELALCGFEVEFIEKPVLNEKQRLELRYLSSIKGYKWVARNDNGSVHAFKEKPIKDLVRWKSRTGYMRVEIKYDFISWEDKEPYSILELFSSELD